MLRGYCIAFFFFITVCLFLVEINSFPLEKKITRFLKFFSESQWDWHRKHSSIFSSGLKLNFEGNALWSFRLQMIEIFLFLLSVHLGRKVKINALKSGKISQVLCFLFKHQWSDLLLVVTDTKRGKGVCRNDPFLQCACLPDSFWPAPFGSNGRVSKIRSFVFVCGIFPTGNFGTH